MLFRRTKTSYLSTHIQVLDSSGAKGTCQRFGGLNVYGCNRNYMMCQFISV